MALMLLTESQAVLFVLRCAYVEFEWDEGKNKTNRAKHGVSFESATLIFDDPHVVLFPERIMDGEERWQAIGSAGGVVVLAVAHTVSDESGGQLIRIISARKATPGERKLYAN